MDNRRKSLLLIIFTFMIVTVPHVAIYAGGFEHPSSFWLGWPYSLAVEASIIVCAYFTKWQTTKLWAWVGYFGFVAASGIMNVGYIQPETFPAWTYALFPTAAISLLGFLYRQVDRLVQVTEAGKRTIKQGTVSMEPAQSQHVPALSGLVCLQCGATAGKNGIPFSTQEAVNAHMRFCAGKVATNGVEVNGKH